MKDWKVKVYWDTMGITQKSLKVLRDEIVTRARNKISTYEYPTEEFCCGYLIVDHTTRDIVVIGDGFRTDGGGEGGAGYKSAQCLFHLFGIAAYPLEIPLPHLPFYRSDGERDLIREAYGSEYLLKGSKLAVRGQWANRSWEDSEGNKHSIVEIRARELEFLGKSNGNGNGNAFTEDGDSDIPF